MHLPLKRGDIKIVSNKTITIRGTAQNGKAGALVITAEGTPCYLQDHQLWDPGVAGREVEVTGILINESGTELKNSGGEYSAGVSGKILVLRDVKWNVR